MMSRKPLFPLLRRCTSSRGRSVGRTLALFAICLFVVDLVPGSIRGSGGVFVPAPSLDSRTQAVVQGGLDMQSDRTLPMFLSVSGASAIMTHPLTATAAAPAYQLFGYSAAELFPVSNVSIVSWLLYIFLPSWRYTKPLALVAPVINALFYLSAIAFLIGNPEPNAPTPDLATLDGIVTAFRNPDGVFAGWFHYCVFDPLVGLGIVLDSQEKDVPHLLVVPCIILTLLLGPIGFLSYLFLRTATILSRGGDPLP